MKTKTGKLFIIYSAAAILIASVIRFFQYVSIIDFRSGFFNYGCEKAGMVIYAVLIAAGLGFGGLALIGTKKKWTALTVSSDGMGGRATFILGISYLIAAIFALVDAIGMNNEGFFKLVCSYAFAIALGVLGLFLMKNSVPPSVTGFINLFPALYFFFLATDFFTGDLVIKNRSDSLILLLILVLGTLFFASAARFYSRLETKFSRTRELVLSGFSFILSGVHVVSKLLAYAFGGNDVLGMEGIPPYAVILMIISGAFLITLCTTQQRKEIDYILPEKKEEKTKNKST